MLRKYWVLALVVLVAGCASIKASLDPSSGPVSEQEIDNARADQVPVIIYDTSFSHGAAVQAAGKLTVKLINVSDKQIDQITLLVVSCAGGGQEQGVYTTLSVTGPFAPKGVFETHPILDSSAGWSAAQTSQMMIKAADVTFHDGSKQSFTDNISELMGSQMSNYCVTAKE